MHDIAREALREYIARHAHLARVQNALEVLAPCYDEARPARQGVTEFLTLRSLMQIAYHAVGGAPEVRDYGLLESALARPQATMFGRDACPSLHGKAAALLHSLVSNYGLVDGNERLGWLATATFVWINA